MGLSFANGVHGGIAMIRRDRSVAIQTIKKRMTLPSQIRAARSLLGFSQADVAARAGVSVPTMKRAEQTRHLSSFQKRRPALSAASSRPPASNSPMAVNLGYA